MDSQKWERFQQAARGAEFASPPVALIVDSPSIPGYLGISTLDYMTVPEVWLEANLRIEREFPEGIFLPGFWAEIGMCAEPSGFGCKVSLYANKTPVAHPMIGGIEEWDRIGPPNPLTAAAHVMGVSNFLLGMKLEPDAAHKLLRTTTTLVKDWLHAQAEALQAVESILVLDDIAGMMSPRDYQEFAHPYLKEVFAAFPGALKLFHNDTDNPASYQYLPDLGLDVFNFTHLQPLAKVRELVFVSWATYRRATCWPSARRSRSARPRASACRNTRRAGTSSFPLAAALRRERRRQTFMRWSMPRGWLMLRDDVEISLSGLLNRRAGNLIAVRRAFAVVVAPLAASIKRNKLIPGANRVETKHVLVKA